MANHNVSRTRSASLEQIRTARLRIRIGLIQYYQSHGVRGAVRYVGRETCGRLDPLERAGKSLSEHEYHSLLVFIVWLLRAPTSRAAARRLERYQRSLGAISGPIPRPGSFSGMRLT